MYDNNRYSGKLLRYSTIVFKLQINKTVLQTELHLNVDREKRNVNRTIEENVIQLKESCIEII